MMKSILLLCLPAAVLLTACNKPAEPMPAAPGTSVAEPDKTKTPRVSAKDVKVDGKGAIRMPPVVAPAPPKPAGGPQAPGLPAS